MSSCACLLVSVDFSDIVSFINYAYRTRSACTHFGQYKHHADIVESRPTPKIISPSLIFFDCSTVGEEQINFDFDHESSPPPTLSFSLTLSDPKSKR